MQWCIALQLLKTNPKQIKNKKSPEFSGLFCLMFFGLRFRNLRYLFPKAIPCAYSLRGLKTNNPVRHKIS